MKMFESLRDFGVRVERMKERADALSKELRALPIGAHPQQCDDVAGLVAEWMSDASAEVQTKAAGAILATLTLGQGPGQ